MSSWDYFKGLNRRHRLDLALVADVDPRTGKRRKGYETEEEAIAEDKKRARLMNKILPGGLGWLSNTLRYGAWRERERLHHLPPVTVPNEAVRLLQDKLLTACSSGRHLESLALSFSMRALRLSAIGALLEGLERYADNELASFTVLNANWVFTPAELLTVSAATIKNQFLTHLRRIGVAGISGPFVAFLHREFEPTSGKFVLHFHGVTTNAKYRVLLSLSKDKSAWGYVATATGSPPIRSENISDRIRQFSYLLKSYWPQKGVRVVDGKSKRDRRGKRIHEPYASIALVWLHRQAPANIAVLQGCRFMPTGRLRVSAAEADADAVVGERLK